MEKINLYRRAANNNGVAILSEIEFRFMMENATTSARYPEAKIVEENVWSSSQGNWGGENGIATYVQKYEDNEIPVVLRGMNVYKIWQGTFNNDGYARENEEDRMSAEADSFNDMVKAVVVEQTSEDVWNTFRKNVAERVGKGSREELIRVALLLDVE